MKCLHRNPVLVGSKEEDDSFGVGLELILLKWWYWS